MRNKLQRKGEGPTAAVRQMSKSHLPQSFWVSLFTVSEICENAKGSKPPSEPAASSRNWNSETRERIPSYPNTFQPTSNKDNSVPYKNSNGESREGIRWRFTKVRPSYSTCMYVCVCVPVVPHKAVA